MSNDSKNYFLRQLVTTVVVLTALGGVSFLAVNYQHELIDAAMSVWGKVSSTLPQ